MRGDNFHSPLSLPVCLERLTPPVACLLYFILEETYSPYQRFPHAVL